MAWQLVSIIAAASVKFVKLWSNSGEQPEETMSSSTVIKQYLHGHAMYRVLKGIGMGI